MIVRCKNGFIVQHNRDFPEYADAGDTARSTGLMAMCGSKLDIDLLQRLVSSKRIVRHPYDPKWNDPSLTSRDQVMCIATSAVEKDMFLLRFALKTYAESGWVNKDILLPHYRLILMLSAKYEPSLFLKLFGYPMLFMHVIYQSLIRPETEQNQTIAMLSNLPSWWMKMFYVLHSDVEANLRSYWSQFPWRDQDEIRTAISDYIQRKINS